MSNTPVSLKPSQDGYAYWLRDLKTHIHSALRRAALAVNRELVLMYWQSGRNILARQAEQGWGAKVIERLTHGWTSCPARLPAAGIRPNARRIAYRI